jgi:hypothetical protein
VIPLPLKRDRRRNETRDLTHPTVVALNKIPGVWASRNNNGHAVTRNGFPITYGLGVGSADVVGCRAVLLYKSATAFTPGGSVMVCLFFALEVKWEGKKSSPAQLAWQNRLRSLGATVAVVHSVEEAVGVVEAMIF